MSGGDSVMGVSVLLVLEASVFDFLEGLGVVVVVGFDDMVMKRLLWWG
jgi:hypothetical protein